MIIASVLGLYYNWRQTLAEKRWLLWCFVFGIGLVMASNQSGWIGAEVGRQPWTVHPPVVWNENGSDLVVGADGFYEYEEREGLRTVNAVSPAVSAQEAATSLILFTILYLSLAAVWILVLDRKIRQGPEELEETEDETEHGFQEATSERQHARFSQSWHVRGE